ncbi:hypothetical protein F8M41_011587 [Gigaspora margarita]|uniref:Uncharacterized protein n=1 Tax=Gigaspora margarita TaxID=4874 RepID=A0A8H3WZU7_GIGMA|nr:hypothetical protein F8M41_011587 [Gigaspora margarita]
MTNSGINLLSNAGLSVHTKTIQRYKKDIAKAHPIKLNEYFNLNSNIFYCFNIDNFYNNHGIRRPNTTTLTSVNYMATCVAKPIIDTSAALAIVNNNCSFFNLDNFSEVLIIKYLYSEINVAFDISYNSQKFNWINNQIQFEDQNQIELLTIYMYNDAISEHKEERSMKNLKIIYVQKQNLKLLFFNL